MCLPAPVGPVALDRIEEPGTIDDVLRNIDRVIDWAKETRSGIGYFAVLYRRITLAIRDAVNDGRFLDGARIERLDVAFAKRYFNALNAYFYPDEFEGLTLPWEVAFVGDPDHQAIILQHMLAGLNAHISFDLGLALLSVAGDWPDSLRKDYDRVNELLCGQIPGINREVQRLSPELRWARLLIPDEIRVMQGQLTKMREGAWLFARYMAMHPPNAREKTVHQEAWTATLSSWYLQPTGRWSPFPRLIRAVAKHECDDVRSNLDALEGISRRPEKAAKGHR
ncbi:DUF5995 family protein [Mycobacterium sp. 852002-51057_SCH5723018]|uniref:DUF5995 family protein n=1 Tax=Mycobacterium sp. 852002-51057_SCH5723018 TaxID=1834094 RepID=UPI0007FD0546|nr:DUF5995 family protein [Mycobacterium sp. 852002-51057_SCH5723018]OBG20988.1 hypothetical protein A5764_14380 [Mycobacterium sp. 852002-51057_SCH5723018]